MNPQQLNPPQPNHGFAQTIAVSGHLEAMLIRKDGTRREIRNLSPSRLHRLVGYPIQWWRGLWHRLRMQSIIPRTVPFSDFLAAYGHVDQPFKMREMFRDPAVYRAVLQELAAPLGLGMCDVPVVGLVVTGGANFLATDFASGQATPRISAMNFHDSGTGTTAATSTDSGLQTQAGPATRATGTQSNPVTNQYKSIGTISYTSTLAITEWGIFSAATGGTMWDRRVFSAINVVNTDQIQFTYTLTVNAGGS